MNIIHRVIIGCVCVIITGILAGCPGKKEQDVIISNTAVVKDISKSVTIRNEIKKRIVDYLAVTSKGEIKVQSIKFIDTIGYSNYLNYHYIAMEWILNCSGYGDAMATAYMVFLENDGTYSVLEQSVLYVMALKNNIEAMERYPVGRSTLIKMANNFGHDE